MSTPERDATPDAAGPASTPLVRVPLTAQVEILTDRYAPGSPAARGVGEGSGEV